MRRTVFKQLYFPYLMHNYVGKCTFNTSVRLLHKFVSTTEDDKSLFQAKFGGSGGKENHLYLNALKKMEMF